MPLLLAETCQVLFYCRSPSAFKHNPNWNICHPIEEDLTGLSRMGALLTNTPLQTPYFAISALNVENLTAAYLVGGVSKHYIWALKFEIKGFLGF
jgi:hypothetical protein